jgi:hypothetical protein
MGTQNLPVPTVGAAGVAVSQTNETGAAMLGARARAEIEARAVMAMRNPRNVERFRDNMLAACDRPRFADAAMYEKPVGGNKTVAGLSIRFAEECARNYGNLDTSVVVISEDDERRVLEAVGVDLETNVVHRTQAVVPKYVERLNPRQGDEVIGHRTNSRGVTTYKIRATDDAMFTEHQKAAAKAKREVILMHIPSDIREECEERIERTLNAVGDDPEKFRKSVVAAFDRVGVVEAQIEKFLGKPLSGANIAELKRLKRIHAAISQGETTWAAVTAEQDTTASSEATPTKGAAGLKAAVPKTAPAPESEAEREKRRAEHAALVDAEQGGR